MANIVKPILMQYPCHSMKETDLIEGWVVVGEVNEVEESINIRECVKIEY